MVCGTPGHAYTYIAIATCHLEEKPRQEKYPTTYVHLIQQCLINYKSNMAVVAFMVLSLALVSQVYSKALQDSDVELLSKLNHLQKVKRQTNEPKTYYTNALIYTVDENDPNWDQNPKDTMVVQGKDIVYVGDFANAPPFENSDVEYNVQQAVIIPGLHDVHQHPLEAKSAAGASCFLNGEDDLETLGRAIKQSGCANQGVDPNWALGHGHSIMKVLDNFNKGGRSPREILDEAIPDLPAIMMEQTSHSVWVNSKALEKAGINETTNITGGVVWKDKDGKPNGILLENAGNMIMSIALSPTPDIIYENEQGLMRAMKLLNRNGITSVVDARAYWQRGHDKIWEDVRQNHTSNFTVRAVLDLWAAPEREDQAQLAEIKKRYNDSDDLLKITGVKVYIDGLLQTTTAAMLDPYGVNNSFPGISQINKGINYFTEERLANYMIELQSIGDGKGFDFNVHAVGDRGTRQVLNAINQSLPEQDPNRPARHRLTHIEMAHPDDFGRFVKLHAIADFQVAGNYTMPDAAEELIDFVGEEKAYRNVPVKSIADTGAMVTFSSDWDVSDVNPFIGMHHALHRANQSVSIKKAVEMYTRNAAFVMRQENKVGSLTTKREADFIILNKNIFDPNEMDKINQTCVAETVFRGKSVFRRDCKA